MIKDGNWVGIRRDLLEHIEQGRISIEEAAAFVVMLLKADKAIGSWIGSAKALAATFGDGSMSERDAKEAMTSLSQKGYIRQLRKRGQRGNKPIVINKYEITAGSLVGRLVNAANTVNYKNPATEDGLLDVPVDVPVDVLLDVLLDVPYSIPQDVKTREADSPAPTEPAPPAQQPESAQPDYPMPTRLGQDKPTGFDKWPLAAKKQWWAVEDELRSGVPKVTVGGKSTPKVAASPRRSLRDWSESVDGISAADIRAAIIYHLDTNPRDYHRNNLTVSYVRRFARSLVDDMPEPGLITKSKPLTTRQQYKVNAEFVRRIEEELAKTLCKTCDNKRTVANEFTSEAPCPDCETHRDEIRQRLAQEIL